jgi:hypothetical protein
MAFTVAELDAAVTPVLGDQSTDRYDLDLFRLPAYKAALQRLIALFYPALAQRKNVEENLSELLITRVFQTNRLAGVTLDPAQLGHEVWTIAAVYAEPRTYPEAQPVINPNSPLDQSFLVPDRALRPGAKPVRRMTMEQMNVAYNNGSLPGSEKNANGPWRDYGYYIIGNRSTRPGGGWEPGAWELLITPESLLNRKYVGIAYYKVPPPITAVNSVIELPRSMLHIMRDLALNELGIRQGDGTRLYDVSQQQAMQLFSAQA